MVDAVVTWVNGSDPIHKAKREKYLATEDASNFAVGGEKQTRWVDNNEIWYCVHLIRKNAPWIENIYLVTDNQVPASLDECTRRRLGVSVVDHKTIFTDLDECLPTFNSISIESVIHNIPCLSEQFLYFNDDVFALRTIRYEDYFSSENLRPRGRFVWIKTRLGRIAKNFSPRVMPGYNDYRGGPQNKATRNREFRSAHAPHPLSCSKLRAVLGDDFVYKNAQYKFRHKDQLNPFDILYNQGIRKGFVRPDDSDWEYLELGKIDQIEIGRALESIRCNQKIKTICVQALDEADAVGRQMVYDFLNQFM